MNNQRNNNRRRGRGSNRGGGNGGNQGNRIDSRARGNAPQLLEKYRKLAHEASLNDDRVLTEYYLQFADHYFRVIADGRAQKEESRNQRRSDEQSAFDQDDLEFERDFPREDTRDGDRADSHEDRHEHQADKAAAVPAADVAGGADAPQGESPFPLQQGAEGEDDLGDNPFAVSKPRRKRPARKNGAASDAAGIDPGSLPPAIGHAGNTEANAGESGATRPEAPTSDGEAEETPRPRRRLKMPRRSSDGEQELARVD